jgi:uncharacterized membrane protein
MIMRLLASAANHRVESPEQILRRRYASGELDEETYEHMLEKLSRRPPRDGEEPRD